MIAPAAALLAVGLTMLPLVAAAAEPVSSQRETVLERENWKAEIAAARARAAEHRQQLKAEFAQRRAERLLHPPPPVDPGRQSSEEVLRDSSLQYGDVVSTIDGFFLFVGKPEGERSPEDFVPLVPRSLP